MLPMSHGLSVQDANVDESRPAAIAKQLIGRFNDVSTNAADVDP